MMRFLCFVVLATAVAAQQNETTVASMEECSPEVRLLAYIYLYLAIQDRDSVCPAF